MNTNPVIASSTLDIELFFKTVDDMILANSKLGQTVVEQRRDKVAYGLMYGLGLHVTELLNLDVGDVYAVSSKSMPKKKSMELHLRPEAQYEPVRHMPIPNGNVSVLLDWYLNDVRPSLKKKCSQDDDALFIGSDGKRLQYSSLAYHFGQILEHAGLDSQNHTIHDLRRKGLAARKAGQKALNRLTMNCFHEYPLTTEAYNPSDPILKALVDAHRKAIENDCSDDNHAAVDGEESSQ